MPSSEYAQRLDARRAWAEREQRVHIHIGNVRLVVVLVAAWIGWIAFSKGTLSGWWLAAPAAAFLGLIVFHERVLRSRLLAERAVRYYERGIARLEDRWAGSGETGERFRDSKHPYAEDLDLFGKGSLFELLSTARTRAGEDMLASWLLTPADSETVRARQAAATELMPKLDLREELALLGEDVRAGGNSGALIAWAEAPVVMKSGGMTSGGARIAASLLSLAALCCGLYYMAQSTPASRVALILMLAINTAFGLRFRPSVLQVAHGANEAAHDLSLLAKVFALVERGQYASPRLSQLREALESTPAASQRIARLNRLMELLDSRENWLMRIVGPPLLYGTQVAFALEAWRADSGPHVRAWIAAVAEFEALSALAGYAYEHPEDPFPEVSGTEACFEAEGLGHPLLPEARCVRNDLKLGGELRLLVVSGSNMSGKSTLLRSAGVSAVMALTGAPVRAKRLRIGPLSVGASIRSGDSLQDGTSRFYAEIMRLRQLVDLAAAGRPLLFLIDELLTGTNSHDRQIGAEAVVRGLVNRGAIGLVTTHDLALTQIATTMAARGANVHFEDHLENGRITFDYIMRPGVVKKSNAIELMRSVGLDI